MSANPTNEFDAGNAPEFSVYAPHYYSSRLVALNITFARARQIAEAHGAFVYRTSDLPAGVI